MPTYINNSNKNGISYADKTFFYGKAVECDFFVPDIIGLEKISDEPPVAAPVVYSGNVTDGIVEIENTQDLYRVRMSAVSEGGATVYIADNAQGIKINAGTGYVVEDYWRYIGKIRVEGSANIVLERVR